VINFATDTLLSALDRQSASLAEYALDVFLDYDFNDHAILGGRLTGGHIVTYLAREADRMADVLFGATGRPVPPDDRSRRWELSENGHLRPAAVMVDDIQVSTERLREAVGNVEDWSALDETIRAIPSRRLMQLVVHLVDLGRPWDELPSQDASAAASVLTQVLHEQLSGFRLTTTETPAHLKWSNDGEHLHVSGPAISLLAWATGRTAGVTLPPDLPTPAIRVWI
jgi:hypothetical protein